MNFEHRIEGVGEVDAEDLLNLLSADNVHDVGTSEVGFSCLYNAGHAQGDRNPSAHINRDSLLWRCKGCGRAGNLLELVKLGMPHGTSHPEALAWLRENFGEVIRKPRGGSLTADLEIRLARARARFSTTERTLPIEGDTIGPGGIFYVDWKLCMAQWHDPLAAGSVMSRAKDAAYYMMNRGFAPEVLADWGVGYDHWSRRITIPVRDPAGQLVGFKGRSIDDRTPKYLLLGDTDGRELRYGNGYGFDMHDARTVLFGLDRAKGGNTLVVCEGELDAIACHAAGVTNAVALGTKSVTDQQLWLLRAHATRLVLFLDSDDAGQSAVWGFADDRGKWYPGHVEKLSLYFVLLVVDDHEGDPASMPASDVRQLTESAQHWIRYCNPSAASL